MANFKIEADGAFSPSDTQVLPRETVVTFTLGDDATWETVYIFGAESGTPDRGLFGSTSVTVSGGGTISSTAIIGSAYTLSVSSTGLDEHGVRTGHNGSIKVGGG